MITFKAHDPDTEAEASVYATILIHYPWSRFGDEVGPDWLQKEDGGSHRRAFRRLVDCSAPDVAGAPAYPELGDKVPAQAAPFCLRSVAHPALNLAETTWRELRRLQTTLVMRSEGELAAQEFADHVFLLEILRVSAGRLGDDDGDGDGDPDLEQAAGAVPHSNAFGVVDGGDEAVQTLFGGGAQGCKQASIVSWFVGRVRGGDLQPARVLLHGPGGCGKTPAI